MRFSRRSLVKSSGYQCYLSDPRTRPNTMYYYPKMILEGLTGLKEKVMELNPNFIQHIDVESLLTSFVENFFSSMSGGNTDTPMLLDFCLRFPRIIKACHRYELYVLYKSSGLLLPSAYSKLGDVDINFCDVAKLPKPLSGCLSKKKLDELDQ